MPTVSIIVTTYNRPIFLKETIASILNQTFKDFEVIVVDNCSNYNFYELINSFKDNRIKAYQNYNNGIIAINRNFGINKSIGEYIAFCDDDDLWFTNKLAQQISHFNSNDIIGVGSNYNIIDETGKVIVEVNSIKDKLIDLESMLTRLSGVALSSLLIRNDGFRFNEDRFYFSVEDFDFQLKSILRNNGKIILLGKPLIFYRTHSGNQNSFIQLRKSLYISLTYKSYFSKNTQKKVYNRYYSILIRKYLNLAQRKQAMHCFCKSILYDPRITVANFKSFVLLLLSYPPFAILNRLCK